MIHQPLQFWPQYNTIPMKGRDNMDSKKPTGENRVKFDDTQTVRLAYHEMCMTRNHKTVLRLLICWAGSVVLVVGIFEYMWPQYDYVSSTEYSGVYNITDSQGNVVSSDLTPEDVIRIMEDLSNGNS